MHLYMYIARVVFNNHCRDSHVVKRRGVLVYFVVFSFVVLPLFLTFHGFNMKSGFRNKLFRISNQAHAMDFAPTEPGRSSLNRERPGFPLSKQSDLSDVWNALSPLNHSDL
jgi:hypothetical protein